MGSYFPDSPSRQPQPAAVDPGPVPEILPPDGAYMPPRQTVRRPRPMWAVAPATYLLVGINCLVFLFMTFRGVSLFAPTPAQLMYFGANHAGLVLIYGEWWRIVTAMFVHVGIIHLATNMWCLWNLGLLAEPMLGSAGLLAAYILSGAAGNLLSTCYNWFRPIHDGASGSYFPVGAGASGAVFGIAGVLIILLKSPRLPVPPVELSKLRKSVIYFAAINFIIGISSWVPGFGVKIDNMAHLGGFACGLLFAAPLVPRMGSPRRLFLVRRRVAVVTVVAVLVLFGFFLAQLPG
jgi:rhomboid protease GluP